VTKQSSSFRYYEKEHIAYDRITAILDYFPHPKLVEWKIKTGLKEANKISREATNIGSNVDEAIKADIAGLKPVKLKTDDAKYCYEAYQQWKKDYGYELSVPTTVFSDELVVAGTPDLYSHQDGGVIIDVKCSSKIRDSYWLQTEFYARNIKLSTANKAVLRLDKNLAFYEFKKVPLSDFDWEATVGLIKAYRFYNKTVNDGKEDL